jgi:hypothetical protein
MKRINRRDFAKLALVSAAVPLVPPSAIVPGEPRDLPSRQKQSDGTAPATKAALTPEQSAKLIEAVAKREEQLAPMRARTLSYAAEPAFVFHVRTAAPKPTAPSRAKG